MIRSATRVPPPDIHITYEGDDQNTQGTANCYSSYHPHVCHNCKKKPNYMCMYFKTKWIKLSISVETNTYIISTKKLVNYEIQLFTYLFSEPDYWLFLSIVFRSYGWYHDTNSYKVYVTYLYAKCQKESVTPPLTYIEEIKNRFLFMFN